MKKNLVKEIATRSQSIDHWSMGYYLPNPDPILKKMGKDISVYRELLSDPHLSGCVRRRKAVIKGLEYRITTTGREKIDQQLWAMFANLPLNNIITEMMDAVLFGYQVLEIIWQVQDGLIVPVQIVGKPQEWFVFDDDNQLRLRTKEHWLNGVLLPERKFLLATQEASYTNPYGTGDLSKCFWAATFKKGGLKFWLEFMEKYGSPWLIGKHHRAASDQEKDLLLDSLEAMVGTAIAAIPDDASIEIVESASKGASSDNFEKFLKYCKAEIAIAILGQNQTTEAEANRASSQAGLEVTEALRFDDAKMVQAVFDQLLKWICELNFSVENLPKFELYEQEQIDKIQAERDVLLTQLGVQFSEQYVNRVYGFEHGDVLVNHQQAGTPKDEPARLPNDKPAEFAEPSAKMSVDGIINQLERQTQPILDAHLASIQAKLDHCTDLAEFQEKLDEMIGELDYEQYAKLLSEGMMTAHLLGRYEVEQHKNAKR